MKKLLVTSILGLLLCAQSLFSGAMGRRMDDAFVQPWKRLGQRVGKGLGSVGMQMREKMFPQAAPAIDPTEIQSLMGKIANLRADLKPLAQQRGKLRSQIFAAAPTTDTTLKDQLTAIGRKMGSVSGQRTKLRNRLTELFGTKHGDMPNLKARLSDLDRQLSILGSDKRSLESQFDTMLMNYVTPDQSDRLTNLNNRISTIGTRVRSLEKQLDNKLMSA